MVEKSVTRGANETSLPKKMDYAASKILGCKEDCGSQKKTSVANNDRMK